MLLLLRLPSKTSINESEFKYDFIPKTAEPKVPHLTKEAVKHAIAQNKAKQVENNCLPKKAIHTSSLNPILRTFSTEVNPLVPNLTFRRQNKQIDTSIVRTAIVLRRRLLPARRSTFDHRSIQLLKTVVKQHPYLLPTG